jgi:hypothetical protein
MPRRVGRPRKVGRPRTSAQSGAGVKDWFKKAGRWISRNKAISKIGNALDSLGVPGGKAIATAGGSIGLGRPQRAVRAKRLKM